MIKTQKAVCQDIYKFVKASDIYSAVNQKVGYTGRKTNEEECCIAVQDGDCEQVQTIFVYVRIYVKNITSEGKSVENVTRTQCLENLCTTVLESGHGDDFRFELKKQLTTAVDGKDEYVISNKLKYQHLNG